MEKVQSMPLPGFPAAHLVAHSPALSPAEQVTWCDEAMLACMRAAMRSGGQFRLMGAHYGRNRGARRLCTAAL